MNKREFNTLIRSWSGKDKMIDTAKVLAAPAKVRHDALLLIVRKREPVLAELAADMDLRQRSWLNSMGYLYTTKGKRYTFIHTSEHTIR